MCIYFREAELERSRLGNIEKHEWGRWTEENDEEEKNGERGGEGGGRDKCLCIDSCPPDCSQTDTEMRTTNQTNPSKIKQRGAAAVASATNG